MVACHSVNNAHLLQIKTTRRYHLNLSEWLKSTRQETTDVGEDVQKEEPSCPVGGNAN